MILGVEDKVAHFEALLAQLGLDASQCAFVGDDLPDAPVLARCGLAVAVANAVRGGEGRSPTSSRPPAAAKARCANSASS